MFFVCARACRSILFVRFPSQLFWYDDCYLFRRPIYIFFLCVCVQIYNAPVNEVQAKLIFKPLTPEWKWKFIYEPIQHDVRILSKKIPITKFLNLQVWWCLILLVFLIMTWLSCLHWSLQKCLKIDKCGFYYELVCINSTVLLSMLW
jgi:hypothetical protein